MVELSAASLLEVDSVVRSFGGVQAVNGATFSVREGSLTGSSARTAPGRAQ